MAGNPEEHNSEAIARPELATAVEEWLRSGSAGGTLWVYGRPGSGRTSAVAAAIEKTRGGAPIATRLRCLPEMFLEEILDDISALLEQAGNSALTRTLDQRTPMEAKVAVLLRALKETRVVLWLDDFDEVAGYANSPTRGPQHGALLDCVLAGCQGLAGSGSRVIIVSSEPCTPWSFDKLSMADLPEHAAAALWELLHHGTDGNPVAPPVLQFEKVPPLWHATPLALRILFLASRRLDGSALEKLLAPGAVDPMDRFLEAVSSHLSAPAWTILRALAVFPPEPSRQVLREILTLAGMDVELQEPREVPALRELEDWGLLTLYPGEGGNYPPPTLHQRVRQAVSRWASGGSEETARALQVAAGAYYLKLAQRSASPWDLLRAWRSFSLAGCHDEAYEIQKAVMEEVLQRGHIDLARFVLEQTVESSRGNRRAVALGNLAMVHKSTGDHPRAQEIYGQVTAEFLEAGDLANAARSLHQLGNTHYVQGNYAEALSTYQQSLEISTQLGHRSVAAATKIQVGNALYQCGDHRGALESYSDAVEEVAAQKDDSLRAALELQIAQIHLEGRHYLEAEAHLATAEASARAAGDLRNLLKVLLSQGVAARQQRDYDTARKRYDAAIETAQALGDGCEGAASLILKGELETERLQLGEAIACHLRAKQVLHDLLKRGNGGSHALEALQKRADQCLAALMEQMGEETFQRVARSAGAEKQGSGT